MDARGSWIRRVAAAALALAATLAFAHSLPPERSPAVAFANGATVSLTGRLAVLDVNAPGTSERHYTLVDDAGGRTRVKFLAGAGKLRADMRVQLSGHGDRDVVIVDAWQVVAKIAPGALANLPPVEMTGTLALTHEDYFASDRSRFFWTVETKDGRLVELAPASAPADFEPGMTISVAGHMVGNVLEPQRINVLAPAPAKGARGNGLSAVTTTKVLVIVLKFSDTASFPFTQAQVQTTMTGAGGVAPYYAEASFGQQLLDVTVTPVLTATIATPTTCDYYGIATAAEAAVQAQTPLVLANYQKFVYLFASVGSCGWAGLGQVGGSRTWSNQYNALWVIGHELGHAFGLMHSNMLDCGAAVLTAPCSRSEYGDPFALMGNIRTSHFNAFQKNVLGWITDAQIATWKGGTSTYTLAPLEAGGAPLYAVQVPAAQKRVYWMESRAATGFDAHLSSFPTATNGAFVRLGPLMHQYDRSEWGCSDTCYLDMTPATAATTDGQLAAGSSWTDTTSGVTLSAIARVSGGLVVTVSGPPTLQQFAVYRRIAQSGAPFYRFLPDYGYDHRMDTKVTFGSTPADIPLVGRLGYDGLSSYVIYRNGTWLIDTNRDGTSDRTVAFGLAGDLPVIGDVNGDGNADLGVYRNGTWYFDYYANGGAPDKVVQFGLPGDLPMLADINGDGIDDLIMFRNGTWFVSTTRTSTVSDVYQFGLPGDLPLAFDFDGDGRADLAVYRNGTWYISTLRDGNVQYTFQYGLPGDFPLVGKFW